MKVDYLITILVAVISSTGGWSVLQLLFNRKARRLDLEKSQAETDRVKIETLNATLTAEENKRELLAAAQLTAQRAALDSAADRYRLLRDDYDECRRGLREVRVAAFSLIDVLEMILSRVNKNGEKYAGELSAKDVKDAKSAISVARDHLNK